MALVHETDGRHPTLLLSMSGHSPIPFIPQYTNRFTGRAITFLVSQEWDLAQIPFEKNLRNEITIPIESD